MLNVAASHVGRSLFGSSDKPEHSNNQISETARLIVPNAQIPGCSNAYCKFQLLHGPDWQRLGGMQDGITQIAGRALGSCGGSALVWNFPLDVAYRASNVWGWPQLVVCVYGADWRGRDVIKGYGSLYLPTCIGRYAAHCITLPHNFFHACAS